MRISDWSADVCSSDLWLGLGHDEGPFYQTLRVERYREVATQLVKAGKAYYAYETRDELDAMRAQAMGAGRKPRYNGYYREPHGPQIRRPSWRGKGLQYGEDSGGALTLTKNNTT